MVPVRVPPNEPVPELYDNVTPVFAVTFSAVLVASCDSTVTLKPAFCVGLAGFIVVMASFVGSVVAVTLTLSMEILARLPEPPLPVPLYS